MTRWSDRSHVTVWYTNSTWQPRPRDAWPRSPRVRRAPGSARHARSTTTSPTGLGTPSFSRAFRRWMGALVHAYGPATEVPDLLRGLAANDDRWGDLHNEFVGEVLHQGSTYSASAPALQVLAELANAPGLAPKRRLDLLYTLFLAGSSSAQADAYGYRADDHATEVQTTVIGAVDQLLMLWPSVSRAEQRLLLLLAALAAKPVPESDRE